MRGVAGAGGDGARGVDDGVPEMPKEMRPIRVCVYGGCGKELDGSHGSLCPEHRPLAVSWWRRMLWRWFGIEPRP